MPLFSMETLNDTISMPDAWEHIVAIGDHRPRDNRLLPKECDESEKIIWLESFRQCALKHCDYLSILQQYVDFREYVENARPDPTRGEWIWLYAQIAEHASDDLFRDLVQIMACRNALLPFLESIPEKEFSNEYHRIISPWRKKDSVPAILYQDLEVAIQEDAPSKVAIIKMYCRHVTDEEILNRAIALRKGAVIASMLEEAPVNRIVKVLITAHTNWENPAPLFEHILPQYEDEIAAWRDPWGNGFFWYLYRRPFLSRAIIEGLPPKVLATFGTKNRYEISPEDLWTYFRPAPES